MKTIITILIATFLAKATPHKEYKEPAHAPEVEKIAMSAEEYYDKICGDYGVDVSRKCKPTVEHLMYMEACIEKYKLPKKLIFRLIQQESAFDSCAVSPRGAWGYMQTMPGTFEEIRKKLNLGYSALDNIEAGCYYMAWIYNMYEGNERLALAAYNSGPYNQYTKNWKIPPYEETVKYIEKILN